MCKIRHSPKNVHHKLVCAGKQQKKYEASNDKIVCDERVKDKERKKKNKENHPD